MPKSRDRLFQRRKAVALVIETSNHYGRQMLLGIRSFMSQHADWAVHLTEQGRGAQPPRWLARWKGDGIIARVENKAVGEAVQAVGVPAVNVSATELTSDLHTFISDSNAVAKLAAEHLIERGFEYYGYLGDSRFKWSMNHGENFRNWIRKTGVECMVYEAHARDASNWDREQRRIATWIQSLPKPVGIMVNYDIRGQQLLDVCSRIGVRVPDEVAVIGQHNDEVLCEMCNPPLSSVIPNPQQAGYEAAFMLNKLMDGHRPKPKVHLIQPVGVATRQSTDIIAIEDRQIAEALKYVRENACLGIGVNDVLRRVPMSRTLLERKFRTLLRSSPYEEITRHRLRRAKELLSGTSLPIAEIAERTGFSSPEYLSSMFKKHTGFSPARYRKSVMGDRSA